MKDNMASQGGSPPKKTRTRTMNASVQLRPDVFGYFQLEIEKRLKKKTSPIGRGRGAVGLKSEIINDALSAYLVPMWGESAFQTLSRIVAANPKLQFICDLFAKDPKFAKLITEGAGPEQVVRAVQKA